MANKRKLNAIDIVIGGNLRRVRLKREITQQKLADMCGITFQQIQKYEKGMNGMRGSRIVQICSVLNCNLRDLFDNTREILDNANIG